MHTLYLARNLINGKRYIGVTGRALQQRAYEHFSNARAGSQGRLSRAIRKYGRAAFWFSPLKTCSTRSEAMADEVRLIALLRPEYNATTGGVGAPGHKVSAASRAVMGAASQRRPKQSGRRSSDATRRKLRRIGLANKAKWAPFAALGPAVRARKVICLDDGLVHESAAAAARAYGAVPSAIIELCRGQRGRKSVNGRRFAYANTRKAA